MFLSDDNPADDLVELDAAQARHARRVLRLTDGEQVEVFDGHGGVGCGILTGGPSTTRVRLERIWREPPSRPRIELAVAFPKGGRVDDLVAQLSQLGADALIPLCTRRSVVRPRDAKLSRLAQQAIEHARQCRRAHLLEIEPVADLDDVLARPCDLLLVADPQGQAMADLAGRLAAAAVVRVLIGPEGGWSDEELERVRRRAAVPWRFGPHVMRIETAAAAAAAILRQSC